MASISTGFMVMCVYFFFFNDTATTEIYTLSLHDALPIFDGGDVCVPVVEAVVTAGFETRRAVERHAEDGQHRRAVLPGDVVRSEEHTSELQSRQYLVCRLLLEKKKNNTLHLFIYLQYYLV